MKLKKYLLNESDIKIIGRGKTIYPNKLETLLIDFNINKIVDDFENNKIENYLVNDWEIKYYFVVLDFVLTFSIDEYDKIFHLLKSIIRDNKIKKIIKT
ncbi:hypothetical protein Flavo103_10940 [Flavobacterium collinsii]|uniref:hypothetical protein n=1 Tax=Flavobacterium collinsii TaxID=1114861 RepID=UPI0022C071A4|nr:hypothetical protein [Flavobacterium collinsii]GIQ57958.1 hypothetical protein Flavo103_10940 [Flavobacterium collinsii]